MKIQCDVCNKQEASVFCTADDAALCGTCDHRVHHANKLASKHQRFSFLYPSAKDVPLCDVCQNKRAFLFCRQDRAILCRDCDAAIHTANEHTQKHDRFLLTGVKLSVTSAPYVPSPSKVTTCGELVPDHKAKQQQRTPIRKPVTVSASVRHNVPSLVPNSLSANVIGGKGHDNFVTSCNGIDSTSSISEYLMETLPGWHVEDFLDSPPTAFGFSYKADDDILPFMEIGTENSMSSFSSKSQGIWVPQAPPTPPAYSSEHFLQFDGQSGLKMTKQAATNPKFDNTDARRWTDDVFTVPQISPQSIGSKRFWPL